MLRIYVRKPGENTGRVYRCRRSILNDKVAILHWGFVKNGIITESEWAKSEETIANRFGLTITERKCDGRTKRVRSFEWFTWRILLQK